ncbi:S8 family peptidase [candidate division KSB1 bacterium]|nr:S8 family peptidase [candidate division KSB1 bacterium]
MGTPIPLLFALLFTIVASGLCGVPDLGSPALDVMVKWRQLPATLDAASLLPELDARIEAIHPALPVSAREAPDLARICVVRARQAADVAVLLAMLSQDVRVEYAERRPIRYVDGDAREHGGRSPLDGVPDDPFYTQQWGLQKIEMESAWNLTRGDPTVAIAVVDLGVDFTHPELAGQSWSNSAEQAGWPGVDDDLNGYIDDLFGYDFVDGDGDPTPSPRVRDESHGTHVAGVIGALRNNGRGIAGIAPDCKIMGIRAGSNNSIPYGFEGVYYAWRAGARVINCSWGGGSESAYERDVLNHVLQRGAVVVAAAGNNINARTSPHYPAASEGVLSVSATRLDDRAADFTQYGPWIKLSAPGVAILSTMIDTVGNPAYDTWQGTSMAAPFVSAVCGLVVSRYPGLTGLQVAQRVASSADPIDALNSLEAGGLGLGRLNAYRALADSVSGVRIAYTDYLEIDGDGDGHVEPGESAELVIGVWDELGPLSGVHALVLTREDSVGINNPLTFYPDMIAGHTFANSPPVRITLPPESRFDRVIPISVDFLAADNRLIGRATTDVILDSTFVVLSSNHLQLGFAEHGSLGYHDYTNRRYLGPGLRLSERPTGALYHGSFVLAADGQVIDNFFGDAEFARFDWTAMPDSFARVIASPRADREVRTTFEDRGAALPLFARVQASGLAFAGDDQADYLSLEYVVTNRSVNRWDSAFVGLMMDWDLGPSSRNRAQFDTPSGIAVVSATAPGQPLIGLAGLNTPLTVYSVLNNREQLTPAAGWDDNRKWQILQSGIGASPGTEFDLSLVTAVGPFELEPGASRTVVFAVATAGDMAGLQARVDSARAHYGLPPAPDVRQPIAVETPRLYPNPLPAYGQLRLQLPLGQTASVVFYNLLGQELLRYSNIVGGPTAIRLDRSPFAPASGLVLYRIETASVRVAGKLLILR